MIRYFVQIEYDGTDYHGFQKQTNTKKTIQHHIDKALSKVANHKVSTICSGRTDAGVHALNQFIHFDTKSKRNIDSNNRRISLSEKGAQASAESEGRSVDEMVAKPSSSTLGDIFNELEQKTSEN